MTRESLRRIFKNSEFVIHFDEVLVSTKVLLTLIFCGILQFLIFIKLFWIMVVWMTLSIAIDILLMRVAPNLFPTLSLSEQEQIKYKITANELLKYLYTSPKIRIFRNLISILITAILGLFLGWNMAPLFGIVLGAAMIDPLCRRMLDIKAPFIFNSGYTPTSSFERHRCDPNYAGSMAWNAARHHRKNRESLKL